MADPIIIFKGTTGLNTVDDPARINPTETGLIDVTEIINMTIDRSGRPMTRTGLTELQSGNFHSLFCDRGDCFVVKDNALYSVGNDGLLVGIRSDLTSGAKLDYVQSGEYTYYTNGYEYGKIKDQVSYVWSKGTYTGPDTTKSFDGPPKGNHLEILSGRIFISVENVLYWSELFNFDVFNYASSFIQFNSKILFIQSIDTGLFVSTERNVYFLTPTQGFDFIPTIATPYPGIEWSNASSTIAARELNFELSGRVVAWNSPEGAILGLSNGSIINLNKNKIIYPENVSSGFGNFMGYHYIHGME